MKQVGNEKLEAANKTNTEVDILYAKAYLLSGSPYLGGAKQVKEKGSTKYVQLLGQIDLITVERFEELKRGRKVIESLAQQLDLLRSIASWEEAGDIRAQLGLKLWFTEGYLSSRWQGAISGDLPGWHLVGKLTNLTFDGYQMYVYEAAESIKLTIELARSVGSQRQVMESVILPKCAYDVMIENRGETEHPVLWCAKCEFPTYVEGVRKCLKLDCD